MNYIILFFILGIFLGSFFMVVADRVPKEESIVFPPSHCNFCNHRLSPLELIPIFSFIIQRGKCKNCKEKLSVLYPLFEFVCGILFALAYISFGFSLELIIALTFISMIMIIVLSDIEYMIIPDSVLITTTIILSLEVIFIYGFKQLGINIINGLIAFIFMYLLRLFGNFLFKQESMGGGDIKLMFLFGFVLGFDMSICSVFLAAIIGLPISLILLKIKKNNVIPFGPFLSIAAIIILLLKLDFQTILSLYQ